MSTRPNQREEPDGLQIESFKDFQTWQEGLDTPECYITDVKMLKSGTLLAADYNNCTLKAFDKEGHFLGDVYFEKNKEDYFVRCIAVKDDYSVYVTLPGVRMIAHVQIKEEPREITEDNPAEKTVTFIDDRISTVRRYHGIAYLPAKNCLVTGTKGSVDLLDLDGGVIQHIDQAQDFPFTRPINIATTDHGNILVSDSGSNCVFLIKEDLTTIPIPVDGPREDLRGITCDDHGNVLFCGEKGRHVKSFSAETRLRQSLRSDCPLQHPIGIHFQRTDTGKWLVISQKNGQIKIFKYL